VFGTFYGHEDSTDVEDFSDLKMYTIYSCRKAVALVHDHESYSSV